MLRPAKIVALLLLALWLPATLHCTLESADLLPQTMLCLDGSNDHCAGDHCAELEDNLFKPRTDELQVAAPDLYACLCHVCLLPAGPPAAVPEISASPQDKLLPLQRTWQFAHRTALPARAPDTVA
jgi:hypothetical protein